MHPKTTVNYDCSSWKFSDDARGSTVYVVFIHANLFSDFVDENHETQKLFNFRT